MLGGAGFKELAAADEEEKAATRSSINPPDAAFKSREIALAVACLYLSLSVHEETAPSGGFIAAVAEWLAPMKSRTYLPYTDTDSSVQAAHGSRRALCSGVASP
jgi:hypothetical protein